MKKCRVCGKRISFWKLFISSATKPYKCQDCNTFLNGDPVKRIWISVISAVITLFILNLVLVDQKITRYSLLIVLLIINNSLLTYFFLKLEPVKIKEKDQIEGNSIEQINKKDLK